MIGKSIAPAMVGNPVNARKDAKAVSNSYSVECKRTEWKEGQQSGESALNPETVP